MAGIQRTSVNLCVLCMEKSKPRDQSGSFVQSHLACLLQIVQLHSYKSVSLLTEAHQGKHCGLFTDNPVTDTLPLFSTCSQIISRADLLFALLRTQNLQSSMNERPWLPLSALLVWHTLEPSPCSGSEGIFPF